MTEAVPGPVGVEVAAEAGAGAGGRKAAAAVPLMRLEAAALLLLMMCRSPGTKDHNLFDLVRKRVALGAQLPPCSPKKGS